MLIVDDDAWIIETLREILTREGWEVQGARNGFQALAALAQVRPTAILLDLAMPVMNGWRFLAVLREEKMLCDIPVVVITEMGEHTGALGRRVPILRKPINLTFLLEVLENLAARPNAGVKAHEARPQDG